jgi:hypothetical protein
MNPRKATYPSFGHGRLSGLTRRWTSPRGWRSTRPPLFDPIQGLGGLAFLTILGLSAFLEWRVVVWIVGKLIDFSA